MTSYTWEVRSVRNEYAGMGIRGGPLGVRPETLFYIDGPGCEGTHGYIMYSELYFDTREEAERAIPLLKRGWRAGIEEQRRIIKEAIFGKG